MVPQPVWASKYVFSDELACFTVSNNGGDESRTWLLPVPDPDILQLYKQFLQCDEDPQVLSRFAQRWRWFAARAPRRVEVGQCYAAIAGLHSLDSQGVQLHEAIIRTVAITRNLRLQHALACIALDLYSGAKLGRALEYHPAIFSSIDLGQLRVGEGVNGMSAVMKGLADFIAMTDDIRAKFMLALVYPIGVSVLLYGVVCGALYMLLPMFTELFRSVPSLPLLTRILVKSSDWVVAYPALMLSGPLACSLLYPLRHTLTPVFLSVVRRLPLFGKHYKMGLLTLSCRSLSMLTQSGVGLHDAIGYLEEGTNDPSLRAALQKARDMLNNGVDAAMAMYPVFRWFGPAAMQLETAVTIGAKANTLGAKLENAAVLYQEAFKRESETFSILIEPMVTIVLGGVVAVIVIGLFYPIMTASQYIQ